MSSFYISYRGFYTPTRPPGASRDPGSPSQALWVGEDRTCPPCPRSGRSAPRTLAHRAPWGARKRRRSGSSNDTRLAPPACSTVPERPRMDMGPAQRQPYGPGGHVPRRHRILQQEVALDTKKGEVGLSADWWTTEKRSTVMRVTQVHTARSACGSIEFVIARSVSAGFHL